MALQYRFEGLEKRIALGRYPDVSLSQAQAALGIEAKELEPEVTVAKARWLLDQLGPLESSPVAEIRPVEVLAALRRIVLHMLRIDAHMPPKQCNTGILLGAKD